MPSTSAKISKRTKKLQQDESDEQKWARIERRNRINDEKIRKANNKRLKETNYDVSIILCELF